MTPLLLAALALSNLCQGHGDGANHEHKEIIVPVTAKSGKATMMHFPTHHHCAGNFTVNFKITGDVKSFLVPVTSAKYNLTLAGIEGKKESLQALFKKSPSMEVMCEEGTKLGITELNYKLYPPDQSFLYAYYIPPQLPPKTKRNDMVNVTSFCDNKYYPDMRGAFDIKVSSAAPVTFSSVAGLLLVLAFF